MSWTLINKQIPMIETLKLHLQQKDESILIEWLGEHPEVLKEEDENGSSGFMLIAYGGLLQVLETAIKIKADFSFHEAIIAGRQDLVECLLEGDSSLVNAYSTDGFAPLSLAAFFDRMEIAEILLRFNANPNLHAINPSKVNALHSAVARRNGALCEILLAHGADVNAVQMQQVTALHSAVHRGDLSLVELLVAAGANLTAKMENGDTPLSIAKREGHQQVAKYLEEKGADK